MTQHKQVAMPQLNLLASHQHRPEFYPMPVHVASVVNKVVLKQVSSPRPEFFSFPIHITLPMLHTHISFTNQ
jgi:hypothetical protein